MSRLADDWSTWASACEARETQAAPAPVTEFTLTMTMGGRVDAQRVDVATGEPLLADVVPLFG